jgi:hypothetical protein
VCFDTESKIVRYGCVGNMMEAYYGPRLSKYEERRQREMARLRAEAVEADAKARFLKAVLEGSIELRRATDDDIVGMMKGHALPPLSGTLDAEDVESYEYLLKLRIDRVKASAIQDAEELVARAKSAVAELEATTASALWLRDLGEFEAAWNKMRSEREFALANGGASAPKTAKKKIRLVSSKASSE